MVDELLLERGITDLDVINAMGKIPRHLFVDTALADRSYEDCTPPIGFGQTLSNPYTVALMTQTADLHGTEKVLEIGTGSGYQTAVLSMLAEKVVTVERINPFSNRARKLFNKLHISNVMSIVGDGTTGAKGEEPFDVIIVTAGSPEIPEPLVKQLGNGGRMVIPVGSEGEQKLHIVVREGDRFKVTVKDECVFVPLIGKHGWSEKSVNSNSF